MTEAHQTTLEKVTQIIREVSHADKDKVIAPDTNLFSERILDSVMLINLLNKIESEFSIKVTTAEFIPENFSTVEKLTQTILKIKK